MQRSRLRRETFRAGQHPLIGPIAFGAWNLGSLMMSCRCTAREAVLSQKDELEVDNGVEL